MKKNSLLFLFVFALATTSTTHAAVDIFNADLTHNLEEENLDAIGRSIEYGANILLQRPSDGRNALHVAAFNATIDGDYTLIEYILTHANLERSQFLAFINQQDDQGNTPLHMAYMSQHCDEYVQELLINAGADQTLRNHNHQLPTDLEEETDVSYSGNDSDDEDTELSDFSLDAEIEEQPSIFSDSFDTPAISFQE